MIQFFDLVFRTLKIHRNNLIKTHNLVLPLALHITIRKNTSKFKKTYSVLFQIFQFLLKKRKILKPLKNTFKKHLKIH